MEKQPTTKEIRLFSRPGKGGLILVLDTNHRTIGKATTVKSFKCALTKRNKLSIQVYLFDSFNGYHSGQVYTDDRSGWINIKKTNFKNISEKA